ncbi:MAG: accessory gene regulator B family protein [Eubacteriaceae bacterium]
MLEIISSKIVEIFLKNRIIFVEEVNDFRYGIELLLLIVTDFFIISIIGIVTGYFLELLFFTLGFTPLKIYAGGYHAKTPIGCILLYLCFAFVLIYLTTLIINFAFLWVILVVLQVISIGILYKYAPVESKNKPLSDWQVKHSRRCTFLILFSQILLIALLNLLGIESAFITMMTFGIAVESSTLLFEERGNSNEKTNDVNRFKVN